jgi:hypothetical protein
MHAITPPRRPSTIPVIPPPPPALAGGSSGQRLSRLDRRAYLELDALDTSPGEARRLIRKHLPWWGLVDLLDDTELIATEMITNAIAATRDFPWDGGVPPVHFWLLGGAAATAVAVWDGVPQPPVRRFPGQHDESGRGVAIIDKLSSEWNFYFPLHPFHGKVTRAFIN